MIIIPHNFIFLETPRTGSKSCRAILSQIKGAIVSDQCHVGCEVALGAKLATGLPLVTMTRDPLDHLRSWYLACANKKKPLEAFIKKGLPIGALAKRSGFDPFILNPYRDIADKVFRLERSVGNMFSRLGVGVDENDIPTINQHDKDLVVVGYEAETAALTYFMSDYQWLLSLEN